MAHNGEAVDHRAWQRFCAVISAVNSGDRAAFEEEVKSWRWKISLGEQQKVGLYLMTAVEYQVKQLLKGEPQEDKLKGLAARCYPGVARVLTAGPTAVEDKLRATFDLPPLKRKLSPGELVVVSACIVGSLLANPGRIPRAS